MNNGHLPAGGGVAAARQPIVSAETLAALKHYDVPTVANAIETFDVRPRSAGYMRPEIRCIFPDMEPMAGFAVTARVRAADAPLQGERSAANFDWWDFLLGVPAPRVVVIEDLDEPPGVGAFWGEVQSNIHRALGCTGVVTNGGVRDLPEVRALGFHFFAQHVTVSHAYVRMLDFGGGVQVGGLTVETGDLIHADRHGVQLVPPSIAAEIPAAAARLREREHRIIDYCQSPQFTPQGLKQLVRDLQKEPL